VTTDERSRRATVDDIERELLLTDQLTAYAIANRLRRRGLVGADVSSVEKLLRRNPDRFHRDRARQPAWFLSPSRRQEHAGIDLHRRPRQLVNALPQLFSWQSEALAAWRPTRRGVIEAVTGAGKTMLGVAAALEAVAAGRHVVVLVPTTPLLEQWRQRLLDALPGVRVGLVGGGESTLVASADVTVCTVQSATRRSTSITDESHGLLIADECHRYAARGFRASLLPDYEWRLGLTATLERGDGGHRTVLEPYLGPVVYRLGYARASDDGVIAPFRVVLHGVDLDDRSRIEYEAGVNAAERYRSELINEYGVPADPHEDFIKAVNVLRLNDRGPRGDAARRYMVAFEAYRTALAEAPAKLQALGELAEQLRASSGALLFTEGIASAEAVARRLKALRIKAAAMHSQLDHDERRDLLYRFGSRRIDALVAPRVLDEGIDVPEADVAVVIAASRTRRQMVQRMGRVIRPKPNGRAATFTVLYGRDTREDPATGAHETFLDEVTRVATSVDW
jgi:superfamily II DNA or RNA helicase